MTTINDLAPYLTDFEYHGDRWRYSFPNGHTVSVIPDPRQPFRFEARVDEQEPVRALASEQVDAKLVEVYAMPADEPTVALVTVDDQGRLTRESTVTVGEFTWPVPERTERAGVLAGSRITAALREHGWRMSGLDLGDPHWSPGRREHVIQVPVEPVATNEEG